MTEKLVDWFTDYPEWGILISIGISLLIHVIGVIPSLLITTANIMVWGPLGGGVISLIGEVAGSFFAFVLYRLGLRKIDFTQLSRWKWFQSLASWSQTSFVFAVLLGRLIPFIPSMVVNMFAAFTMINKWNFLMATFLGKIPAMAIEVLISYDLIHIQTNYLRLTLIIGCLILGYWLFRRFQKD